VNMKGRLARIDEVIRQRNPEPVPMMLAINADDGDADMMYLAGEWRWVDCPDAAAVLRAARTEGRPLKIYMSVSPRDL